MAYTRDEFGNVVALRAPLGRCRSFALDATYSDLLVSETLHGGSLDTSTGCGERAFTTTATYDRGLALLVSSHDVAGQPSKFSYDGFGRLTAKYFPDPGSPGALSELPSATYDYILPDDAAALPYSITVVHEQDGEFPSDASYHDAYSYIDGLSRPLVTLSEADPLAGDDGDFVVGGVRQYNAKGMTSGNYQPFFWIGEPLEYPLEMVPDRGFTSQQSDAFGRPVAAYGLDGQIKGFKRYHALSEDTFDALDLTMGPQQGTYSSVFADGHGRTVKSIERIHTGSQSVLEERLQLSEYLPTGEVTRLTQRRAGSPDVVRWVRYDSQGRMVLNVEPNASKDFTPDPSADPSTFKAVRYAYNVLGQVVGMGDARGCGVNHFYDTAGRLIAEDYSPCEAEQATYTAPDLATRTGTEAFYHYDVVDPTLGVVVDPAGRELSGDNSLYYGKVVSIADRGSRGIVRYDERGRVTGSAHQVAKPGPAHEVLAERYAPRWYLTETKLDALGRLLEASTGITTPELAGLNGQSVIVTKYSERGVMAESGSSYGTLVHRTKVDADGRTVSMQLGDAASTQRTFSYDVLRRLKSVQTYRASPDLWATPAYPTTHEATQQLSLEDTELSYDAVSNVTAITDFRIPEEWPDSAKPVSKAFEYDDLYRLTRSTSTYSSDSDPWRSPHDAENEQNDDNAKPSPHGSFAQRIHEQRFSYDYLGNLTETTDDAGGFFRTLAYMAGGLPVGFVGAGLTGENVISGAMAAGYASSPFERAAYGNDQNWPPGGPGFPKGLLVW